MSMKYIMEIFLILGMFFNGGNIENANPGGKESVSVEAETASVELESQELESIGNEANSSEVEKNWEWLEISEGGQEDFLQQHGFTAEDIFYEYKWTNGSDFYLALYYDDEKGKGCGFVTSSYNNNTSTEGFAFKESVDIDCTKTSPFSVYSYNSILGSELLFLDLEEYPSVIGEEDYRFYYEGERLMHIYMYLTHGCNERFYIYKGESDVPGFCLELDPGWGVAFYRFK